MKRIKLNNIKILILVFIILIVLFSIYMINNGTITNKLFETQMKQEEETEISFFKYEIYDNQDNENLKVLVTITSTDNGIEYIQTPNGNKIYVNGKMQFTIDHVCKLAVDEIFKIKEVNKEEVQEVLNVTESGNEEAPFTIANADQLQNITNNPLLKRDSIYEVKECYKLVNEINLSDIEWKPIGEITETGNVIDSFSGQLDGNGYTIKNLTIGSEASYQGLFACVSGTLKNINIENFVVKGKNNVGSLAGYNTKEILNCTVKNSEITSTGDNVGGLIGYSVGTVNKNTTVNINVTGNDNIGGLVGNSSNIISNNEIEAIVNGHNSVGGLVGYSVSTVNNNVAEVTVKANDNVGGLIGLSGGLTNNNKVIVNINGNNSVGGLIGYYTSSANGNVVKGKIENSNSNVGGLIGQFAGSCNMEKNMVNIELNAIGNNCGGLFGYIGHSSGSWTNKLNFYITQSYANANILTKGDNAGGLIGATIMRHTGNQNRGATIFLNLQNTFFMGSVQGKDNIGGLIGSSQGTGINAAYSFGSRIYNSYVNGNIKGENNLGAIFGYKYGHASTNLSYWVPETTGLNSCDDGIMKNLANMYNQNEFTNWDFNNIWNIDEGVTMPYLREVEKPEFQ